MFALVTVSLLALGANALLFPLNNGNEPEPELLFACPAPNAPQFGSLKCDYKMFSMSCNAMCDNGFAFENGGNNYMYECNMFEAAPMYDAPKCVRIGVVNPTNVPVVTARPSTSTTCVRSLNDCFNRQSGDYAYCDNCRMFATCASSGFYVRNCPGLAVFDASVDQCVDYSSSACKFIV